MNQTTTPAALDLDKLGEIADRVDADGLFKTSGDIREWIDLARRSSSAAGSELLACRTVSVDVSTGDEDSGNRIFALLTGETGSDGKTLLAVETSRNLSAAIAHCAASAPADPMDTPLPCDMKVGAVNIRKGCTLGTLKARMESLHRMAMKAVPEPTPEARAMIDAMLAGTWDPAAPSLAQQAAPEAPASAPTYTYEQAQQHAREAVEADRKARSASAQPVAAAPAEPVAWVRFRSDGCYEGPIMHAAIEDVRKKSGAWTPLYAAPAAPVAAAPACVTCGGTGFVDDGEIDCFPNGEPYENGPVKCVKDCPDCAAPAAPVAQAPTATHGPLHLTNRKTADIATRGYNIVGYVLRREDGEEVCISAESAVRWLPQAHYWRLMHEQDGSMFGGAEVAQATTASASEHRDLEGALKMVTRSRDILATALTNVQAERDELRAALAQQGASQGQAGADDAQTQAARDVLAERRRQAEVEGWTLALDDDYVDGQLAMAAACYAMQGNTPDMDIPADWPWPDRWWKPTSNRRNLVKAGALILADIERIDRAAIAATTAKESSAKSGAERGEA